MDSTPLEPAALAGLQLEAVEWLPSGADSGLLRVRGRWIETARREPGLPALSLSRGEETHPFESLPDARFARDPALWRATYLVPAWLMEGVGALALAWPDGRRLALPAPERGFEPPPSVPAPEAPPTGPGGEVIDRAVLAERRARRAEAAEQAQARRAAEALKAVEVLELRSAELERRLEAVQQEAPALPPAAPPAAPADDDALSAAIAQVKRLRGLLADQRARLRRSELLRAADAVALASLGEQRTQLAEQAAEQVRLAGQRAAADAAAVRARAADQLAARDAELAAIGDELTAVRAELMAVREHAAGRVRELEERLSELEAALAAERTAGEVAASELKQARAQLAVIQAESRAGSVARAALEAELERARRARAALAEQLDAVRAAAEAQRARDCARIAELEAAARSAPGPTGGLLGRIAELERASDGDLARRAGAQAAAAAAQRPAGAEQRRESLPRFDAAAAALRARSAPPEAVAPASSSAAPVAPVGSGAPAIDAPSHSWLRGALVTFAHDDPSAAARLLVGLLPAQGVLLGSELEYDLTISGAGTYAVSIAGGKALARPVPEPRSRRRAAFHLSTDAASLAELLAGVDKKLGRWHGSVRIRGRRRAAESLRELLPASRLDLSAAVAAGARLEPELVFRAFAYAIHPAWTVGHRFTVAQEIVDPEPQRWHVVVRDGARVVVRSEADRAPDAVVSMTRAGFDRLLRGEAPPSGERPAVRGNREAVALLRGWTDRARGLTG